LRRLGKEVLEMTTPEQFNEIWQQGSVVNDYGSGTGRAEKGLLEFCSRVNMVDFAAAALEVEAQALIGERLTYTIAPLESLPDDFPVADWGICINVLMTVDPALLKEIMWEMRRTCRNLIVETYDWPDVRLGRDLTTIKGDAAFWAAEMRKFWPVVESFPSPEHARRYITIGRSYHDIEEGMLTK
jgi:SAM-dependent methyltransferase